MTGFSYTPATLRGLVRDWTDLALDYEASLVHARPMVTILGPGEEYVSESHAYTANQTCGQGYFDSLSAKKEYCWSQAQKCQNALNDYLGVERRNVREIHDAAQHGI